MPVGVQLLQHWWATRYVCNQSCSKTPKFINCPLYQTCSKKVLKVFAVLEFGRKSMVFKRKCCGLEIESFILLCPYIYPSTLKFLIRVLHFLFIFGIFPTYMAILGPTRLFIFGKSSHLHCFLRNKYQKSPTYTPLITLNVY